MRKCPCSRNSAVTGPKTRVPKGFPEAESKTTALSAKEQKNHPCGGTLSWCAPPEPYASTLSSVWRVASRSGTLTKMTSLMLAMASFLVYLDATYLLAPELSVAVRIVRSWIMRCCHGINPSSIITGKNVGKERVSWKKHLPKELFLRINSGREGFEPPARLCFRFQDGLFRPLRHLP